MDQPRLGSGVLLVLAADQWEFAGFVGGQIAKPAIEGLRWSCWTWLGDRRALLVANGPGRANAAAAVARASEYFDLEGVVSTGLAGALDPELCVGDIVVADRVMEITRQVEYAVRLPAECPAEGVFQGCVLTADSVVVKVADKNELYATGARAVEMEAAGAAELARYCGVPFYCVRVISDDADTSLPLDFNRARRSDGSFSGWRVAKMAAIRPWTWYPLVATVQDARFAIEALGRFFRDCRF